jgi:hypothetical protein
MVSWVAQPVLVTGYGLGNQGSILDGGREFFVYPLHSASSEAHPASCTMRPGDLSGGKCGWSVLLTADPLLMLWVRKERSYISSPPVRQNWHGTGSLNVFVYHLYIQENLFMWVLYSAHFCKHRGYFCQDCWPNMHYRWVCCMLTGILSDLSHILK